MHGFARVGNAAMPMGLPGSGPHSLKGDGKCARTVKVSGNRRVTFGFVGKYADSVNYEDYQIKSRYGF